MDDPRPVVRQYRDPEATSAGDPASDSAVVPVAAGAGPPLLLGAVWAIVVGGVALFLAFGSVTIETGWRQERSLRVVAIWSWFLRELPDSTLLRVVVVGTIAVVLLGSALGLWLALTSGGDSVTRPSEPPGP